MFSPHSYAVNEMELTVLGVHLFLAYDMHLCVAFYHTYLAVVLTK